MKSAGYVDIEFTRVDAEVVIGKDVEDAIAFQIALGPAGEVYREAGEEAEAKKTEITAALTEALQDQKKTDQGLMMPSSSWVISAVNPG